MYMDPGFFPAGKWVHLQGAVDHVLPATSKLSAQYQVQVQVIPSKPKPQNLKFSASQRKRWAYASAHHSSKLTCQCSWRMAYGSKCTSAPDIVFDVGNVSSSRTLPQQPNQASMMCCKSRKGSIARPHRERH